eukprot:6180930-Pleurochrysis_carterae.AAC.4
MGRLMRPRLRSQLHACNVSLSIHQMPFTVVGTAGGPNTSDQLAANSRPEPTQSVDKPAQSFEAAASCAGDFAQKTRLAGPSTVGGRRNTASALGARRD